jgi:hypothetical protein
MRLTATEAHRRCPARNRHWATTAVTIGISLHRVHEIALRIHRHGDPRHPPALPPSAPAPIRPPTAAACRSGCCRRCAAGRPRVRSASPSASVPCRFHPSPSSRAGCRSKMISTTGTKTHSSSEGGTYSWLSGESQRQLPVRATTRRKRGSSVTGIERRPCILCLNKTESAIYSLDYCTAQRKLKS